MDDLDEINALIPGLMLSQQQKVLALITAAKIEELKKLLIWLGFLSKCCGAKTKYLAEYDQTYCSGCERRIR